MKLILISNPENIKNETNIINEIFENGLEYFHLRKPTSCSDDLDDLIIKIKPEFHKRIIVHYYYDLLKKYKFKGLHFNESTINRVSDYKNIHHSYSAHNFNEVIKLKDKFDYLFLSPIFDSISKINYKSNFLLDDVHSFISSYKLGDKLVALGGISAENISIVKNAGFYGAAIMGSIWNSKDSVKEFLKIKSLINV